MSDHKPRTLALHAGHVPDTDTGSRAVPIYQTTSYVFKDTTHAANLFGLKEFGNIYTRLMNPTTDVFEKRLAALEGGTAALATASGMSAIFLAVQNVAGAGSHIVSSASLYGGTDTLFRYTLPRYGMETELIEDLTPAKVSAAIRDNTRLVYLETIGNPKGDVLDIPGIAAAAHEKGVPVFVDNTFAPIICRPLEHGADVVIHSCTKWIGGHGTTIGGILVDGGKFNWGNGRFPEFTTPDESYHGLVYWDAFRDIPGMGNVAFALKARVEGMRNLGVCPSPFNTFLLIQGVETLPLRMPAHCANALALAKFLRDHELVDWVSYTGLPEHPYHDQASTVLDGGYGAVFGFGVKGGQDKAEAFVNNVQLASHLANVGDAKTLVIHPASTTHAQLTPEGLHACGITPEFVRVAVGIEDIDDLKGDFDQALRAAAG